MSRAYELTDLRAIAIVLLFFVHSNLQLSAPFFALELQKWVLSVFFFVSGYLTYSSVNKKGSTIKDFLVHRFAALYIPFVLIMAFYVLADNTIRYPPFGYVLADNFVHYHPLGFLSYASFLCLFFVFSTVQYEMFQFWFIPMLLGFTVFFVLLYKFVKNDKARLLALVGLFVFDLINYVFVTPIRFIWGFGFYVFVFAAGYEVSRRDLFQKLRKLRVALILVLIAVSTQILNVTLERGWPLWDLIQNSPAAGTEIGRLYAYSFLWIGNTAFSLSSLILILTLLFHMRQNFSKSKVYGIVGILGSCTLYIYLWEPYVSPRINLYIFGTSALSGSLLFVSVLIRLVTVTPVAYGMQKLHNRIDRAFENRVMITRAKENIST